MAVPPPGTMRRGPRHGSVARPVNARTYRGTWLLVGIPFLIAAFSVSRPAPLPRSTLPPAFDAVHARTLAEELATLYPDRRPGSRGAVGSAGWVARQLRQLGFRPRQTSFEASVPGLGKERFVNVAASVPGRSPETIVVLAHRDDTGAGPGAVDNASGTASLLEIARLYGRGPRPASTQTSTVGPAHTLVFLSTDGGEYGWVGADYFLKTIGRPRRIVAVVDLDSVGGAGRPGIQFAGDRPRSTPPALLETAASRIAEQSGFQATAPTPFAQLIDLAFPFNLYEHALFVGEGIPAITLTAAGDRPPGAPTDTPSKLRTRTLRQMGRASEALVASLDQALDVARGTSSYLFFGSRIVHGWALQLALISALLPFLIAAVDLFARCRRRRIRLGPALGSYRRRTGFWLFVAGLFALFALVGNWDPGTAGPPPPDVAATGDWPVLALAFFALLVAVAWLVARERLLPHRPVETEEELAGATVALLALGILSLVVAAVNPYTLLFVLPSLHAWLWLPQVRRREPWIRAIVFALGLVGPALLVGSFAIRFGLGLDSPWYLARLAAAGWIPIPLVLAFVAWLAAGGQLAAIAAGRYAPYPGRDERPRRGLVGHVVHRAIAGSRARRRRSRFEERSRAVES